MDISIIREKALGCLTGVALGDALGMPTEFMTMEAIKESYDYVTDLVEPGKEHIHSSLFKGQVTDDTEQTLYMAKHIIKHRRVTPEIVADSLLEWAVEKDVFNKSYLGPNSRKALEKLQRGEDPRNTGGCSNTVGAAMRIAPIGIINLGSISVAVSETVSACLPTHGSSTAISAAAAVSASIATAMMDNAELDMIIAAAIDGAGGGQNTDAGIRVHRLLRG